MRKFKLIKEYIGSPRLGTIARYTGDLFDKDNDLLPSVVKDKHFFEFWEEIIKEEIIEYPIGTKVLNSHTNTIYTKKQDGWYKPSDKTAYTDEQLRKSKCISVIEEKVVEKDYEILQLSLKRSIKPNIIDINNRSKEYILALLNCDGNSIHSIKRLSDGEIFTIGDITNIGTILSIRTEGQGLVFNGSYKYGLNDLKHVKQPLFTTEDGVDIFENKDGEIIWWSLQLDNWKISNAPHICKNLIPTKTEDLLKHCRELRFSTKEAAEEYILMNKPCLSLKETILAIQRRSVDYKEKTIIIDKLKALVKSKL